MLAASRGPSNVPPDYLQTTPIITLPATTANQLGKLAALTRFEENPADASQHRAPGQQPGRLPDAVGVEQKNVTVHGNAQATAIRKTLAGDNEFPGAKEQPADGARDQRGRVQRQGKNQHDAEHSKNHAGKQHHSAKQRIRTEFG